MTIAPAKPKKRPPLADGVEPGDHVYARHPERGPIALKVLATGEHGFIGRCDQKQKHRVTWDRVLGHKARMLRQYEVVDQGADGAILADGTGRRRFLAGAAAPEPPAEPKPTQPDDPLTGGLPRLRKAETPIMTFPAHPILFIKAGVTLANRAGLALRQVTDRQGHQTKRWQRTGADAPSRTQAHGEKPLIPDHRQSDIKDSAGKPQAAPMKHGDVVTFRHGDVEGRGKIVGSGADGVTLRGEGGETHQVRHEHLTGKDEEASAPAGGRASDPAGGTASPKPLLAEAETTSLPAKAAQPFKDQESLYKASESALDHLWNWLNRGKGICDQLGFETVKGGAGSVGDWDKPGGMLFIAPLKGTKRAKEKVDCDYGGDWSQLRDTVRCSIAVDRHDELPAVMERLKAGGLKLAMKPKDRFVKPVPVGYRDMLMNVEFPNGVIGEVQLHVKPMLKAKAEGHQHYETERSLEAKTREAGGPPDGLSEAEATALRHAQAEQERIYHAAWQRAAGKAAERGREVMSKAMRGSAGKSRYTYFEHEGAMFRRKENGITRGVDDVLHGDSWKPYQGKDRLGPALYGEEVPDPLAKGEAGGEPLTKARRILFPVRKPK